MYPHSLALPPLFKLLGTPELRGLLLPQPPQRVRITGMHCYTPLYFKE